MYHVKEWRNATGILQTACPDEWAEIIDILTNFRLLRSEILAPGGRKSLIASRIDEQFYGLGWQEKGPTYVCDPID